MNLRSGITMFSFKLGNSQNELLRRQKCTASETRYRLSSYTEKKKKQKKKLGKRMAHEIYSTITAGRKGEERGLLVVQF